MFLHYGLVETNSFFILVLLGVLHFIKNNKSNSPPLQIFHSCKMFTGTVDSPNTAPLLTASPLIPLLIFKSRLFFLVIYDSLYCHFAITQFFCQSRERRYWGVDCITEYSHSDSTCTIKLSIFLHV